MRQDQAENENNQPPNPMKPEIQEIRNAMLIAAADAQQQIDQKNRMKTDTERLNHLEQLLEACPHTEIQFDEDEEEKPWVIETAGCDVIRSCGTTFRDAIDASMDYQEEEESA